MQSSIIMLINENIWYVHIIVSLQDTVQGVHLLYTLSLVIGKEQRLVDIYYGEFVQVI